MPNPYYNAGSYPATGSAATSAGMRSELALIAAGFDKMPTLSGAANQFVVVNAGATALTTTATLPASTVTDNAFTFQDNADNTRKFQFDAAGISTATTRTYTMPNANTTLVGTDFAQTLTNKTLTTPILSGTASGVTAGALGYLSGALSYGNGTVQRTVVNLDEAQTLTNKTLSTGTAISAGSINGTTVGATTPSTGAFTTLSASSTVSGTGFSTYLASPPAIGGTAAAAGSFTTLSASSTVSGTGFSTYLASPPAIGGTVAAAGSFTTLTTSSTVTINGGTANGIPYLNASKVLTTGTALAYDGTSVTSTSATAFFPQFVNRNSTADANASYFVLDKIRGAAIVQNGDTLGNVVFRGFDGTSYLQGASITAVVSAAPGLNDMPADLVIGTTSDGANAPTERVRVTNSGDVFVRGGKGVAWYDAGNTIYWAQYNSSGAFIFSNGTERARFDSSGNFVVSGASLRETRVAMAANDINLNTGNYFTKTISGTTTLTVSNIPASGTAASFILDLTNGGSATITWWSGVKWPYGTAPTLTLSGRDTLGLFTHDGGTTWTGLLLGKDVR